MVAEFKKLKRKKFYGKENEDYMTLSDEIFYVNGENGTHYIFTKHPSWQKKEYEKKVIESIIGIIK